MFGRSNNYPVAAAGQTQVALSYRQANQLAQQSAQIAADAVLASVQLSAAQYLTITAMNHVAVLAQYGYALAGGDEYIANQMCQLINGYVGYAGYQIQYRYA